MTLVFYLVAFLSTATMALMAIRADRQLQPVDRLPIHWNRKLEPDGFGSRRLALWFMPFLFGFILISTALALHLIPPGPINKVGSPEEALTLIMLMAAAFLAIKYFCLKAIFRWVARNEG